MRWKIETFEQRFWKYVKKTDDCWLWTGGLDKNKRGVLRIGRASEGRQIASRASWIVHHGKIPDGLFVLHDCDNPQCVRPDHLHLGTQKDNIREMISRKRHWLYNNGHLLSGERGHNSKLTWEKVRAIRALHAAGGITGAAIGMKYGVTKECIYGIVKMRTWRLENEPTD